MPYAAFDDLSIYAIGNTPDEAVAKARRDAGDPQATFQTALIDPALAQWIDEHGWNGNRRSFRVENGAIVDTTND
jgi:hypothetical protein